MSWRDDAVQVLGELYPLELAEVLCPQLATLLRNGRFCTSIDCKGTHEETLNPKPRLCAASPPQL